MRIEDWIFLVKKRQKNYILRIGKTDVAEQFIGISEFHNI